MPNLFNTKVSSDNSQFSEIRCKKILEALRHELNRAIFGLSDTKSLNAALLMLEKSKDLLIKQHDNNTSIYTSYLGQLRCELKRLESEPQQRRTMKAGN